MPAPDRIDVKKIRAAFRADDGPRGRALAKLALIEARLDAERATLLRASGYYERIVRRFERTQRAYIGMGLLSLKYR